MSVISSDFLSIYKPHNKVHKSPCMAKNIRMPPKKADRATNLYGRTDLLHGLLSRVVVVVTNWYAWGKCKLGKLWKRYKVTRVSYC